VLRTLPVDDGVAAAVTPSEQLLTEVQYADGPVFEDEPRREAALPQSASPLRLSRLGGSRC